MPRDEPVTSATLPSREPAGRTWVITDSSLCAGIARMATSQPYNAGGADQLEHPRDRLTAGGRMNGLETVLAGIEQWAWIGWIVLIALFLVIEMLTLDFTFLMLSFGGAV